MSKRTGTKVQKNRTDDEFIMLPTVDFCFKELMRNGTKRNYCSVVGSKTGRNQGDKIIADRTQKRV